MSIDQLVPMLRLTDRMVRSGLVMAWRFATSPISPSPPLEKATTDGVVREPSALGMTTGSPASRTATTELVVPRSMPTALGMLRCLREDRIPGRPQDQCLDYGAAYKVECQVRNFTRESFQSFPGSS